LSRAAIDIFRKWFSETLVREMKPREANVLGPCPCQITRREIGRMRILNGPTVELERKACARKIGMRNSRSRHVSTGIRRVRTQTFFSSNSIISPSHVISVIPLDVSIRNRLRLSSPQLHTVQATALFPLSLPSSSKTRRSQHHVSHFAVYYTMCTLFRAPSDLPSGILVRASSLPPFRLTGIIVRRFISARPVRT